MTNIRITLFVPRNSSHEDVIQHTTVVVSQIADSIQSFTGDNVELSGQVAVFESSDKAKDWKVLSTFDAKKITPKNLSSAIKRIAGHWLKSGVIVQLTEKCPICLCNSLVRVNKWHEVCESCGKSFEGRRVTEAAEGEQSVDERRE